jgi:hypothetical protein
VLPESGAGSSAIEARDMAALAPSGRKHCKEATFEKSMMPTRLCSKLGRWHAILLSHLFIGLYPLVFSVACLIAGHVTTSKMSVGRAWAKEGDRLPDRHPNLLRRHAAVVCTRLVHRRRAPAQPSQSPDNRGCLHQAGTQGQTRKERAQAAPDLGQV